MRQILVYPVSNRNAAVKSLPTVPGPNSLALPRLTVEVLCCSVLERGFFFRKPRGLHERLLDHFLLVENAADGLVVGVPRELEEEGIEDGGLVLLVGLEAC